MQKILKPKSDVLIKRMVNLPKDYSYLLFGPRGVGKTTLIKQQGYKENSVLNIDLLDPDLEFELSKRPSYLLELIDSFEGKLEWVLIDEVQKIPKILDIVHSLIEKKHLKFGLTGSSARKLKRGSANLLAGRAFSFNLHPFSYFEFKTKPILNDLLSYGSLPKIFEFKKSSDKIRFLKSYTQTYLKEEIQAEQLTRKMVSFRQFLEVAAQCNGQIINFAKIARQSKVDEKSVLRYFDILIDTLLGHYLEPFNQSVRKRQGQKPKFYFFDTGVVRAMGGRLTQSLLPSTSEYGNLFEQFVINECKYLNENLELDYKFYYLKTALDQEIDLIITRPDGSYVLVEIKSAESVTDDHLASLRALSSSFKNYEQIVLCREKRTRVTEDKIRIMPWDIGLKKIFNLF